MYIVSYDLSCHCVGCTRAIKRVRSLRCYVSRVRINDNNPVKSSLQFLPIPAEKIPTICTNPAFHTLFFPAAYTFDDSYIALLFTLCRSTRLKNLRNNCCMAFMSEYLVSIYCYCRRLRRVRHTAEDVNTIHFTVSSHFA